MSYRFIKREVESYIKLPPGAYYVKTKNGKKIYKNKYNEKEFYIVEHVNGKFVIDYFVGKCTC